MQQGGAKQHLAIHSPIELHSEPLGDHEHTQAVALHRPVVHAGRLPKGRLQAFAGLARAGKLTARGPRNPRALLELAVLVEHFRGSTLILRPPRIVQLMTLTPPAALARRLGYRADAVIQNAKSVP